MFEKCKFLYSAVYFEPLKALYTSPSNTNSTSMRSIQPRRNYCAKTITSHMTTTVYSDVRISKLNKPGNLE